MEPESVSGKDFDICLMGGFMGPDPSALVNRIGTGGGSNYGSYSNTKVDELLKEIQSNMFEKARAHRDAHTYVATNYDEFKDIIANKPGFVKAMWCGDRACEDKIKEETTATSRCMPFAQEHLSDVCVCCGRPAKKMVYWGKAY